MISNHVTQPADVARELYGAQFPLLNRYVDILTSTGVTWGLLGPREADRMWGRHILNSAALSGLIAAESAVADVGSGAGLPGIPLAVLRPDLRITLIEPLLRRSTFLTQTVESLQLADRVEVVRSRAEDHHQTYDVVVARALAPLARLIGWCNPLRAPGGVILALKGSSAADEVTSARHELEAAQLKAEVLKARAHPDVEPATVVRLMRQERTLLAVWARMPAQRPPDCYLVAERSGGSMIAPPAAEIRLTPGLGWPRNVEVDPRIGWPSVPRETLDWPQCATARSWPTEPVATTTAPPQPVIETPPGPRRARFDVDEFGPPVIEEDPPAVSPTATLARASLPAPPLPRVFVVANQKGGVGKTTTCVNLATALALGGLTVLVVDLDPQGNATTALGVDHPAGTPGTYEVVMAGAAVADHVVESPEAPSLKILPATIDLAGAEIELVSIVARENRLKRAVRAYLQDHHADYVFLDCPPSLGLLTLNALVAANEILVPIQCEYYALEGVTQLLRTIDLVKGELNNELRLSTVLLTMFDARTKLAAQVADEVRLHFPAETLPTVIPRSVRISEAPSYGQTVLTYQPSSAGAISYLEAAQEIARRGVEESA